MAEHLGHAESAEQVPSAIARVLAKTTVRTPTWAGRRPPRKAYQGNVSRTRQLPATGRIPAHHDANGNFYYSLNHLEMTRRAWQAAKDFDEL
jgi:hypothetical protein